MLERLLRNYNDIDRKMSFTYVNMVQSTLSTLIVSIDTLAQELGNSNINTLGLTPHWSYNNRAQNHRQNVTTNLVWLVASYIRWPLVILSCQSHCLAARSLFPIVLQSVIAWPPIHYAALRPANIVARADSRLASSQWETSLHSNAVTQWLSANLESAQVTVKTCVSLRKPV